MRPPGWVVGRGLPPSPARRVPRYRLSYTAPCPDGDHDATWTGEAWGAYNQLTVGYVCQVCSPSPVPPEPDVAVAPC